MNLVKTINEEKKDWMKKYHKIIHEIKRMVNMQMQLQNIVKLVEEANIQIAEIESKILQASNNYQIQTVRDIFSISRGLEAYKTLYKVIWKTKHIIYKSY